MWEVVGAHVLVILKLIGFEEDVMQLTFWPCGCFEDTKVQIISENGDSPWLQGCLHLKMVALRSVHIACLLGNSLLFLVSRRSFMELLKRNQLKY